MENPGLEAGAEQNVFNRQGALRHVRSVLQQPDVAGHQARRDEAKHLPEGKIPGHHRQHGPQRLVANVTADRLGLHRLVGQQPLGMFGIVAAGPGAFVCLAASGRKGFSHLGGHQAAEDFALDLQDFGRPQHALRPLGKGGPPVALERLDREPEFGIDLLLGE